MSGVKPQHAGAVTFDRQMLSDDGDLIAAAVLALVERIVVDACPPVPPAELDPRRPVWPSAPSIFDRGGPAYPGDHRQSTGRRVQDACLNEREAS